MWPAVLKKATGSATKRALWSKEQKRAVLECRWSAEDDGRGLSVMPADLGEDKEQAKGVGPLSRTWMALVLPLNYACTCFLSIQTAPCGWCQ